ncbi:MAG: hypothetical protein ACI9UK_000830 [Candidatus Krumholzibacteriia bacterium]
MALNRNYTARRMGRASLQWVAATFVVAILAVGHVSETCAQVGASGGLPSAAGSDTVRTNLWLTEALMAEIAASAANSISPASGSVRLIPLLDTPSDDMFLAVVSDVLFDLGYDLFIGEPDSVYTSAVDYNFKFKVQNVELSYPEVGRTLGIWQRWVERDLKVAVTVEISESVSGRLLLSERIERQFGDRFDSADFDAVDSDQYDFTTGVTSESGWKSRTEEIVVLGTLVGLVAIYFANTGD